MTAFYSIRRLSAVLLVLSLFTLFISLNLQAQNPYEAHSGDWYAKVPRSSFEGSFSLPNQLLFADVHQDTASFTDSGLEFTGVTAGNADWFDFDNDGDLDLIVAGYTDDTTSRIITRFYQNNSGSYLELSTNIPMIATEHGIAWGDYDRDGDYDLLLAGRLDPAGQFPISKVYRNDGSTLTDINAPLIQLNGATVSWIDYDRDGQLDIFICGSPDVGNTFYTKLYRQNGGTFTEVSTPFPGVWGAAIAWGDYDKDGDADLLLTGYGGGVHGDLWRNDGGTFVNSGVPIQAVNSGAASFADIDNDADLDIVLTGAAPGNNPFARIYRNDGNDQFTEINAALKPVMVSSLTVGDYDNDGDLDLAISGAEEFWTGRNPTTKIYRNDGGTFVDINADLIGTWFGSIAWGDYDNDGDLDLAVTGASVERPGISYTGPFYPITKIYQNNLNNDNAAPSSPASLTVQNVNAVASFQWASSSDDRTPSGALSYNIRVGTQPGASDIISPDANATSGFIRVPRSGNNGVRRSWTKQSLPVGTYYWSVQAVDNAYTGSQFAPEHSFTIAPPNTWHIVSVPENVPDRTRLALFPNAKSNAFAFNHGYVPSDDLETGKGYWLKLPTENPPPSTFGGTPISSLTISLHQGWNLIGSVSGSVPVEQLQTNPPSLLTSSFFGYDRGYFTSATLEPGKGYWIKSSGEGDLIVNAASSAASSAAAAAAARSTDSRGNRTAHSLTSTKVIITDASGQSQTLYVGVGSDGKETARYELPPMPLSDAFDVRLPSNQSVLFVRAGHAASEPIAIQGAYYPVTVKVERPELDLSMSLHIGTESSPLTSSTPVVIHEPSEVRLRVDASKVTEENQPDLPVKFLLAQNYPNPFNPRTEIRYNLPSDAAVSLKVFDVLGREVKTLIDDEHQHAGIKRVAFDAATLTSGVYFYRLQAGSFIDMKKMLFMK